MATRRPKTACASRTQTGHARECAEEGCLQEVLSLAESIESVLDQAQPICVQPVRSQCAALVALHMRDRIIGSKTELMKQVNAYCPKLASLALRALARRRAISQGLEVLYSESLGADEAIAAGIEEMSDLLDGGYHVFALQANEELLDSLEEKWDCITTELREQYGIAIPYDLHEKTEEIYADLEAGL